MRKQPPPRDALYLYAIVSGLDDAILGPIGLDGATVYTVAGGRASAVVSDAPESVRPQRCHLAAHHEVLTRLMTETDGVLPVAFGVVADGPGAVRRILSRNHQLIVDGLRRVTHRMEMAVRITWDVPNIFEYFVDRHPELRAARDRFFSGHREPSQDEKIDIGRLFDSLLTEDRERHTDRVEAILAPCCVEIKRNRPRHEREAANLACLVNRGRQTDFESAVFEAAHLFDNSYAFDYSGPWPPHSFVDVALELGSTAPSAEAVR